MSKNKIQSSVVITTVCCLAIFAAVGFTSCKKNKADQLGGTPTIAFDVAAIMNCHKENNQYPSQITSGLEGTWVWTSNTCYWTGDSTFTPDKHVVVTFSDAGIYKVFEDSKIESEGTWKLSQVDNDIWSLDTEKPSKYLNGYIWLCKNEVVFFSSYLDGCDYYFVRR